MKQFNTRTMVKIAILTAVSVALYALNFVVFEPLKMDFSDLPVIVTGSMLGLIPGIIVAFLKNLIHLFFLGSTSPVVGEVANMSFSILIMLPFALLKGKKWDKYLIKSIIAILLASAGMFVMNYFVTMPWYGINESSERIRLLFSVYTPFNLVKSAILCGVFALIKPQIDRMN
ncbi:hypothetical protein AOC36_04970 [Erysipelothrix larvae]|uniref:Riboflavin transporter n=1 Tax=Erysipelothrix larvae TaxID=1514105 RepID=A0A0X8GZQ2_9FIRM|nr:ECF transporter S component [Erysipelothrix larvae]AMC93350.1 hypothetical protein AOC36_04970 [Erysipelothrix larvae]